MRIAAAGFLFDWLYPSHFQTLRCCLEAWADEPEVTTVMLKFMAEFVLNKTQRLTFDSSSPNGILLFREVSKARPCGTQQMPRTGANLGPSGWIVIPLCSKCRASQCRLPAIAST